MPSGTDANGEKTRLILVSNRLPITVKRQEDGEYNYHLSSGGLVTGLSGMTKTTKFQWYGWPGLEVPEESIEKVEGELRDQYSAYPIWIDDELADRHYNGFASMLAGMKVSSHMLILEQTQSSGLFSTTIHKKSPLTNQLGKHTNK